MKNLLKITLSLLFIAASFTSCVDDKDFDTPQVSCDDNFITENISDNQIKSFQNILDQWSAENPTSWNDQNAVSLADVEANPVYLVGYVTTNDLKGNFYKELYIQDDFENPKFGIKLTIDDRGLYSKYPKGSKVYVKLNGLGIVKSHGELLIGEYDNNNVSRIRSKVAENNIKRSCTIETIIPKKIASSSEIDASLIGQYIQLSNAQFPLSLKDKTFKDPNEDYSTLREIVFCQDDTTISLESSSYAQFANDLLPLKKFNVSGVLSRDYFDDVYVLLINSTDDFDLLDSNRCDPVILDCGLAAAEGTTDLLVESFDNGIPATWTNYIQEGTRDWVTFDGSDALSGNSVKIGSYNSDDASTISWLISPAINMNAQDGETLEFQTSNSYADDSNLELLYSNDWDGTEAGIETATWGVLIAGTIVDDAEYYKNWVSSGIIDLSCAEGDAFYIAFKYTGSGDSNSDGTYELDEINLKY